MGEWGQNPKANNDIVEDGIDPLEEDTEELADES